MATAVLRFSAAAVTDRGRKRPSNEDAFGFSVEDGVFVVCDGMGGAAAGEIASSLAVDKVLESIAEHRTSANSASLAEIAEQAIAAANLAIHSRAQRSARLSGMGTTLVALLVAEARVCALNIGDSRCYRLRDGVLELCTQDHSLVEEQVRLGRMTRAEATRSPLRNVITRALGTQRSVTPDLIDIPAAPGDLFLLCSDGLTRELSDQEIARILNPGQIEPEPALPEMALEEMCNRLVKAANKAGGHDNITCLLVRAML